MIAGLLIGTLALMSTTTVFATGDDPDDPYQWLEEVMGEKPLAWVKERNAESTAELTGSESFRTLERRILEILDSDARIPAIEKIGPYYYNFWRDARNPRGLWRRTTLDEYKKTKPDWDIVLDLDALAKKENTNWVWHGAQTLRPDHSRALIEPTMFTWTPIHSAAPAEWARARFSGIRVGNCPRRERILAFAAALAEQPGRMIPELFSRKYAIEATYDFLEARDPRSPMARWPSRQPDRKSRSIRATSDAPIATTLAPAEPAGN